MTDDIAHNAKRISLVGASGSGKTYLAHRLSERLGLPHHELDTLRNGTIASGNGEAEFSDGVASVVAKGTWIIDGHYRAVRRAIWRRADTVILLEYPAHEIVMSLGRRYLAARRTRRDAGSATRTAGPDRPRASWRQRMRRVVKTVRERREYSRVLQLPEFDHVKVITLKSRQQAQELLDSLSGARAVAGSPFPAADTPKLIDTDRRPPSEDSPRLQVEFFGFPGSGKTTVVGGLSKDGEFVTRKQQAAAWAAAPLTTKLDVTISIVGRPRLVAATVRFLIMNRSLKREVLNRTARILVMGLWQAQETCDAMLDQGILQHLMSIQFAAGHLSPDPVILARFIRSLYAGQNASVVFLSLDGAQAAQRIATRDVGFSRFEGQDVEQVSQSLADAVLLPECIAAAARAAGIAVVKVDASLPIGDTVASVRDWLKPSQLRTIEIR